MKNNGEGSAWPSAVVACALIALVGTVTVAAILKYEIDSTLKMWAALGTIVGVLTGAFVSYFFSRSSIDAARTEATLAKENAKTAQAHSEEWQNAFRVAMLYLRPNAKEDMSQDEKRIIMGPWPPSETE